MKRHMILLLLSLGILGISVVPYHYTDPELKEYEDSFLKIVKDNCKHLERVHIPSKTYIGFDDTLQSSDNRDPVGICKYSPLWWSVEFDRPYWNVIKSDERKALVRHELSHCYLGLGHTEDPNNYMYSFSTTLPDEITKQQLINNILEVCKD